jgi:hypothetical protein
MAVQCARKLSPDFEEPMHRRQFLSLPLAALAAPGALLAANAVAADAATTVLKTPRALKGMSTAGKDALALRQITAMNVDWFYTWGAHNPGGTKTPFVPMVKDARRLLQQDALDYVRRELPQTKTTNLLGFNEPDHKDQANMSVDEAVRLWPLLEATGLRLGSPATIAPNAAWLDRFMLRAKREELRVDFMTMHCYAWPNAESFLKKVSDLHEKYERPVWVTEYAVADWRATKKRPTQYTHAQVEAFMKATVKGMRAMPFVERFAWKNRPASDIFMGTSSLYNPNGSLTTTGKLYASL